MALDHIMLIEYEEKIGPYTDEKIMLYDSRYLTEAEAIKCLKVGESNENILVLTKKQWDSMFLSGNIGKLKVIDLLNRYNGVWCVFEAVCDKQGKLLEYKLVASHRGTQREKDSVMQRTIHDFAVSEDGGIEIYLNKE